MSIDSKAEPYDLIIIGAGASSALLIYELQTLAYSGRVLILEAAANYDTNKTWSFWQCRALPTYLSDIVSKQWDTWRISRDAQCSELTSEQYRYTSICSAEFFRRFHDNISQINTIDVEFATEVTKVDNVHEMFYIKSSCASYLTKNVFDTRPPKLELFLDSTRNGLFQSFKGLELAFDEPAFDSNALELMKNMVRIEGGLAFVYLLPYSDKYALIEFTCFTLSPLSDAFLQTQLEAYLSREYGDSSYTITKAESGMLPMFNFRKKSSVQSCAYGGILGGAMRASTGYSFQNSIAIAKKQARSFVSNGCFIEFDPVPFSYRILDEVFLYVLTQKPQLAPDIFMRFATKLGPTIYAKFMSETASCLEILRVIMAMPKRVFIIGFFRLSYEKIIQHFK